MTKAVMNSVTRAAIAYALVDQIKVIDKKYAAELESRITAGMQMISIFEDSSNALLIDTMAQTTPRSERRFSDGKEVLDDLDSVKGEAYSYLLRQRIKSRDIYRAVKEAFDKNNYVLPDGEIF